MCMRKNKTYFIQAVLRIKYLWIC